MKRPSVKGLSAPALLRYSEVWDCVVIQPWPHAKRAREFGFGSVTWYARGTMFHVFADMKSVTFTMSEGTDWSHEIDVDIAWLPGCVRSAIKDVLAALSFGETAADKIRKARWAKRNAVAARRNAEWAEQKAKWEAQDAAWYARHPGMAIDGSDPTKEPR